MANDGKNVFEIMTSNDLEVFFQDEVSFDTDMSISYIKSGEDEITNFVKGEIFAKIESYSKEELKKSQDELDNYSEVYIIEPLNNMINQLSNDLAEVNQSLEVINLDVDKASGYAEAAKKYLMGCEELVEKCTVTAGCIVASPCNSVDGFLLANGSEISRETYADLFVMIGTSYGDGDGVSTFNLPDFRGHFLRGQLSGISERIGVAQTGGVPNIISYGGNFTVATLNPTVISYGATSALYTSAVVGPDFYFGNSGTPRYRCLIDINASRSNSLYGAANEVRPVNHAVNWFIKY